jgi:hypothetical protein
MLLDSSNGDSINCDRIERLLSVRNELLNLNEIIYNMIYKLYDHKGTLNIYIVNLELKCKNLLRINNIQSYNYTGIQKIYKIIYKIMLKIWSEDHNECCVNLYSSNDILLLDNTSINNSDDDVLDDDSN